MDVTDWYRIFAWLAIAAEVALVAALGRPPRRRRPASDARICGTGSAPDCASQGLALAALVAAVATAGSLYLSEGAHLVPVPALLVPAHDDVPARGDPDHRRRPTRLVDPARTRSRLALIGAAVSTWHVLIEWYPSLESGSSCDPTNPCSALPLNRYAGYLSIPTMAGSAFLLVASVLWLAGGREPAPEEI